MDKTLSRLSNDIEILRGKMHKRAEKLGLAHPDILHLSCKLDKLIYEYQRYTHHAKPVSKHSSSKA